MKYYWGHFETLKMPVLRYRTNAYFIGMIFTSYERLLIFQRNSIVRKVQINMQHQ